MQPKFPPVFILPHQTRKATLNNSVLLLSINDAITYNSVAVKFFPYPRVIELLDEVFCAKELKPLWGTQWCVMTRLCIFTTLKQLVRQSYAYLLGFIRSGHWNGLVSASHKWHFNSLSTFLMGFCIIPVRNIFPIGPCETVSPAMSLLGSEHPLVNKGFV